MKWFEIKIKTTTDLVEEITDVLYDAGVSGVVIEDPKDVIFHIKQESDWDYYDEEILNFDYEGAIVKGYLPQSEDLLDKIELIKQSVNLTIKVENKNTEVGEVTTTEVYEEDWANSWKKYYKPQKITDNIVVKPTWEAYYPKENEIIIELDPGMAFGTGTHETTTMCIELLEKHIEDLTTVFDIGCGSGILSIAAAKLGAQKVIGIDLDEVAFSVSQNNVKINSVEDIVSIKHGNLMDVINEKADIIVANIIADIIILLSKNVEKFMKPKAKFISSGIILDKIDEVITELERNGLRIIEIIRKGEWAAIVSEVDEVDYNE